MEEWKQIEINGEIWSYEVSTEGNVRNMRTGKILKPAIINGGYKQVLLSQNNKRKYCLVQRLVAEAFIPNPNGFTDVDHINHDRQDNRVENLQWLSHENNVRRSRNKKVYCVELDQTFDSITEASEVTGIYQSNITACCQDKQRTAGGYTWKYVDES